MRLCFFTVFLLLFISFPPTISQSHVIHKRFLWKTLSKLAQPFIRRPKLIPQQQPPSYFHHNPLPHPPPPVFHVPSSAPQVIHIQQSPGQYYQPPGFNLQPNAPPPVYVPPSSFQNQFPQPPWRPLPPQTGVLDGGNVVAPPSFQFPIPGGVSDVMPVMNLFHGSSVFLASSDKLTPNGFIKVPLPGTVLRSVLELGLDEPTVYLADTSIAPSQDFALLEISTETIEALRVIAQQQNSSRAAEMPPNAAENLVMAIKSAAPLLSASDLFPGEGLSFNLTDPLDTTSESTTSTEAEVTDSVVVTTESVDLSNELPSAFLAGRNAQVPDDYIRVLLPDDVLREIIKRIPHKTLNAYGVRRRELTETYLAPSSSSSVRPPLGLVPIQLSREALKVLDDFSKDGDKVQTSVDNVPQLELPKSILQELSKDSSQRVKLIAVGKDTVVKTGSTDLFIAPSNQKPPTGYVSIPLSKDAMSELQMNFLGTSIKSKDIEKGIPVRAYIAPSDKKLPPGHVAIALPDSILGLVKAKENISTNSQDITEKTAADRESTALLSDSDSAIFLTTSRKQAPSSFHKLKLPKNIMDDLRRAIPPSKLAESGISAKDLTTAYLASANEFVPRGFLSITVPDTLVKMLQLFTDKGNAKKTKDGEEEKSLVDGEDGASLSKKIVDAVIKAAGKTATVLFKKPKGKGQEEDEDDEDEKPKRTSSQRRKSGGYDDDDDYEDDIIMYQPQFQMSPFFPASSYPYYVDPYQYGSLWTYGDANQWGVDGVPIVNSGAQNRDDYYYGDNGNGGVVQYEVILPQNKNLEKRQGETQTQSTR